MKTATFNGNKLATTVGANDLAAEIVVTQPAFKIRVNEEVEYEFDQQKFEEYLSSSSSRSASPNRRGKTQSPRRVHGISNSKTQDPVAVATSAPSNDPVSISMVGVSTPALFPYTKAMEDATPVLSKRARQRRRQRLALQRAEVAESMDGVRYNVDLKSRYRQEQQLRTIHSSSKTETNEEVGAKSSWAWLLKPEPVPQTQEGRVTAQIPSKPDPVPSTEPGNKGDHSKPSFPLKGRLGPLSVNRGRVPIKERLGPLKGPQIVNQTGGRINSPKKDDKGETPITDRIGLRVEVKEPVQFLCSQKRKFERATFEKANKAAHPQMKPRSSDEDGIIQGNICQRSIGCSSYQTNELYYRAGGMEKTRKEYVQDTKKFRKGLSQYFSSDPPAEASPYMTRLRTGAISRKDYRRVPKKLSLEEGTTDTDSDSCPAAAFDNAASNIGQPYGSLMIRAKRVNKLLEEALAKRKEGPRFETEMAMQQVRETHDQQVATLTIHQKEPVLATGDGNEYGRLVGAGTITTIPTSVERTQQEPLRQDVQNPIQSRANQQIGRDKPGNSDDSYHFDVMTQLANIPVKVTLQELSQLSKGTREAFTITPDQLTQIVQEALIKQKEVFDAKMEAAMQQIKELQTQERQLESSCYTMPIMPIPNRTSDNGPNLDMVIKTDSPLGNTGGGMTSPLGNTGGGVTSPFDDAGGGSIPSFQHHLARSEENQREVEPVTSPVRRYPKRKKAEGSQSEFRPRSADFNQSWRRLLRERYSFKDEDVPGILEYLLKNDKIKLPPVKDQEEANQISDPKYCGYHRRILHPTKGCFALKKSIQALIEAGVSIAEQTE